MNHVKTVLNYLLQTQIFQISSKRSKFYSPRQYELSVQLSGFETVRQVVRHHMYSSLLNQIIYKLYGTLYKNGYTKLFPLI